MSKEENRFQEEKHKKRTKNSINSIAYIPKINSKEKTKKALELFRSNLIYV